MNPFSQNFSDSEFKKWKEDCAAQGTSPPSLEDLEKKLKDIKDALNYEFKEEDVNQVLLDGWFRDIVHSYSTFAHYRCWRKSTNFAKLRSTMQCARLS